MHPSIKNVILLSFGGIIAGLALYNLHFVYDSTTKTALFLSSKEIVFTELTSRNISNDLGNDVTQTDFNHNNRTRTDLYEHLVVLTAISDNHFKESKAMFASVNHCLPYKKIIVYDLGLSISMSAVMIALSFANFHSRTMPICLHTYAWKPIITKLVSLEYEVIMYGDASLRMVSCDISRALAHLLDFPFLDTRPIPSYAIKFTHNGMISYLNYPINRKDMADAKVLQATCWLLWASPLMCEKLLEPWLDCALHQECIAPEGSRAKPCLFTKEHDGRYIGCHRYDQSALNILMNREFGADVFEKATNTAITDPVWIVQRGSKKKFTT